VHKIKEINENFQEESEAEISNVKKALGENDLKQKESVMGVKTDMGNRLN
jgi:hypothetical protein